jgi:hypothetical protein
MWFPAANTLAWSTGGLEAMRINPNRRVGIGGAGNDFHRLTVVENSNNGASILCQTTSDTVAPGVTQLRVRTSGAVQNGDILGAVAFQGYDGVSGNGTTLITGAVDGVTGTGNVPTRLLFWTTPSGSVTPLERMRINAAGEVGIGKTAATGVFLDVNGPIHATTLLQLTNGFANVSLRESATGPGYRWALVSGTGTFRLQRSANGLFTDSTTPILMDASCVGLGSLNSQTWAFSNGSGGAAFSWNRSNGSAEMNIVNQYDNAALSFEFAQKTGASTASVLYSFGTSSHQWYVSGAEKMRIDSAGDVGINESDPDYKLDVNGTFGFTPGASVTPVDNGDVVFEATNNTTFTVKLKGSDGTVRTGTITLA